MNQAAGTLPAGPGRMRRVRGVYLGISLLMVAIVALGFWPSYFGLLTGTGPQKELFIHVHAAVYVSWMALVVTQMALVAVRRTDLHRKLGQFGIFWGFVVLVVGTVTAVLRFQTMVADGQYQVANAFVIWPLLDMVIFAAFFIPAVVYRRQTSLHKRFMLVATTNLLVAAVFRALGTDTPFLHSMFILLWLSPILIAMAWDYLSERMVHPVYVTGAVVLAASSFRNPLTTTDAWLAFTRWLAAALT